jgi:hypothetical protein
MSARERLTQLIDLASASAGEERGALAVELAQVLADWPHDYPAHMRASFALLLERISRELDDATRKDVAGRVASDMTAPLGLLNEFFFEFAPDKRTVFLSRISAEVALSGPPLAVDEPALIHAVRSYPRETFVQTVSRLTGIPLSIAARAVADASGEGFGLLCKGAGLSRTAYSTIVMLTDASLDAGERKLVLHEAIPEDTAIRLVHFWRTRREARRNIPETVAAA